MAGLVAGAIDQQPGNTHFTERDLLRTLYFIKIDSPLWLGVVTLIGLWMRRPVAAWLTWGVAPLL